MPHNKTRIIKWAKKWRKRLLLQHWTVHITFCNIQCEDADVRAEVDLNRTYLEICIKIFPEFWKDTLITQERTIIHELVHTIVQPLKLKAHEKRKLSFKEIDNIQKEVEYLTEYITNLLWDAYEE